MPVEMTKKKQRNYDTLRMTDTPLAKNVQVKCICCGTKINPEMRCGEVPVNEACWADAVVGTIQAGYGSKFDMATFVIGICDTCIEKKIAEEKIVQIKVAWDKFLFLSEESTEEIPIHLEIIHKHSHNNKTEIAESKNCWCFYCGTEFPKKDIKKWIDRDTTALCPHCTIDSVIGDASKFLKEKYFKDMYHHYFEKTVSAKDLRNHPQSPSSPKTDSISE